MINCKHVAGEGSIQDLKGASNYIPRGEVQLTLEQHGFELSESTYLQIFFSTIVSTVVGTTRPEVGWMCECGTRNVKERCVQRNRVCES